VYAHTEVERVGLVADDVFGNKSANYNNATEKRAENCCRGEKLQELMESAFIDNILGAKYT